MGSENIVLVGLLQRGAKDFTVNWGLSISESGKEV
jgi:hypothetical protein